MCFGHGIALSTVVTYTILSQQDQLAVDCVCVCVRWGGKGEIGCGYNGGCPFVYMFPLLVDD